MNFTHEELLEAGYFEQGKWGIYYEKDLFIGDQIAVTIYAATSGRPRGVYTLQEGETLDIIYCQDNKSLAQIEDFYLNLALHIPQVRYTDKQGE